MDSKELRGLTEAYMNVYAPQEVDEAVKGESPERRKALAAERRAGVKPLSAKEGERYASHKLSQMDYAKRQRMGEEVEEVGEELKPLPKEKMDRQAQRAHKKEIRAAAAGDEKETNRQMQRRIAMQDPRSRRIDLQNKKMAEELDIFDVVLEFLQAEGYAETLEEAEWMMSNLIDEEAIAIILGEEKLPLDQQRRSKIGRQIGKRIDSAGKDLAGSGAPFMPKSIRNNLRQSATKKAGEVNKMVGALKSAQKEEYMDEGHGSRRSFKTQSGEERRRVSMFGKNYEPHKNYDPEANRGQGQILRPNQAEKQRRKGLAKAAMGEEYMDEAQAARENPEKYEREQAKKSAPVRGERTPMPPRGDKRREDFEKWYAANVR